MKTIVRLMLCVALAVMAVAWKISPPPAERNEARNVPDTLIVEDDSYLEMRGMVRQSKGSSQAQETTKGLDSVEITVTNERNARVLFGLTDHKGRCMFRLPFDHRFVIHVRKKGYVEKMIEVDTHLQSDEEKVYTFTFDVDIFEKIEGLDVSVLAKPIARVNYRPLTKTFVYDAEFTNKINTELKKMYRDYYALQKKAADTATTPGKAGAPLPKKH